MARLGAPPGTFLACATAPRNVAEDGDAKSSNGLYTEYSLEELKNPTVKIEDVFKRVRLNVRQHSQGRQVPWESTSLGAWAAEGVPAKIGPSEDSFWRFRSANIWILVKKTTKNEPLRPICSARPFCRPDS